MITGSREIRWKWKISSMLLNIYILLKNWYGHFIRVVHIYIIVYSIVCVFYCNGERNRQESLYSIIALRMCFSTEPRYCRAAAAKRSKFPRNIIAIYIAFPRGIMILYDIMISVSSWHVSSSLVAEINYIILLLRSASVSMCMKYNVTQRIIWQWGSMTEDVSYYQYIFIYIYLS